MELILAIILSNSNNVIKSRKLHSLLQLSWSSARHLIMLQILLDQAYHFMIYISIKTPKTNRNSTLSNRIKYIQSGAEETAEDIIS